MVGIDKEAAVKEVVKMVGADKKALELNKCSRTLEKGINSVLEKAN